MHEKVTIIWSILGRMPLTQKKWNAIVYIDKMFPNVSI